MKKRSLLILLFLIIVFSLLSKYNSSVRGFFLDFINPVKIAYLKLTNLSDSYLKQQENIIKLQKENNRIKELLIEQSNYINQLSKIYKLIPSLNRIPYKSIYIVNTISYVKLNRLNEIILTTPKNFKFEKKTPYGLMQNDVAAGITKNIGGKLYGYLLTNPKCTFSVYIGKNRVNGVAQGNNKDGMIIKFIPRWSKFEIGDVVKTSGLDNIFFPNVPVGVITDIKVLDRYKEAKVKVYAKLSKPSVFFLISDPTPYLTTNYTPKTTFPNRVYPFVPMDENREENVQTYQTQDETVEPEYVKEKDYLRLFDSALIWQKPFNFETNSTIK